MIPKIRLKSHSQTIIPSIRTVIRNMPTSIRTALVIILVTTVCFSPKILFAEQVEAEASMKTTPWKPDPAVTSQLMENPNLLSEKLEKAMRKLLIDPATLTIDIEHFSPEVSSRGLVKKIFVRTIDGSVDKLIIHKAEIEFLDVQLNTTKLIMNEEIDVVYVNKINMDIIIKETHLNSFLAQKAKGIRVHNPKVVLKPGSMELSGSTKYGFVKVNFWATGGFRIHNGDEIWFYTRKMKLNSMTMPRAFVGSIVKRINPVLNLKKFPFRLNLKEIHISEGTMQFTSYPDKR